MIKEKPILFSTPMVKAILSGVKTQTRRVMKPQPVIEKGVWRWKPKAGYDICLDAHPDIALKYAPYQIGDRLWVRETWGYIGDNIGHVGYRAEGQFTESLVSKWRPSIFMPRWASRITLEVTGVRVERLQDITESDAIAEGSGPGYILAYPTIFHKGLEGYKETPENYREGYHRLWDSINGKKYPWESNPWVWVIEFKREEK